MGTLANRITLVMSHYGLTPKEMAEKCGIQRSGLSHILNERNKPSIGFITSLTKAFPAINPNWLLHGKASMFTDVNANESVDARTEVESVNNSQKDDTHVTSGKESLVVEPKKKGASITRIMVFFDDGTFEEYRSKH